jgi:hypothetical protein
MRRRLQVYFGQIFTLMSQVLEQGLQSLVLKHGSLILQNMEKEGELDNVTPFVTNHGIAKLLCNY